MKKTVLVVEDEVLIAMSLQMILEKAGWRVMGPAPTVQDALSLLREELPSVALLDVNLRNEFVTPVAEFLKARNVPFAMASAYDHPEALCGDILSGIPNVGKPAADRLLLATLDRLANLHS